jgi:hypothetical protein
MSAVRKTQLCTACGQCDTLLLSAEVLFHRSTLATQRLAYSVEEAWL